MGETALDLIKQKVEWVQKRMFYGTMGHISENLDSMPMKGMGFSFVQRSATKVLENKMEERLLPLLERHATVQIEFVEALAAADDDEAVVAEYRDRLLETDPLWDVLVADEARADVKEDIIEANVAACNRAAEWAKQAGDREFDSYREFMQFLGKTPETAAEELNDLLYYVELMEKYSDHIDASAYSSVLSSEKVHDWFLETFIEGLTLSEEEVLEEVRAELAE